jgi:hypothetical protein
VAKSATVAVHLVRPICIAGQRREVGELIEVDLASAGALISAGKAVRVAPAPAEPVAQVDPPPAEEPPAPPEPAAESFPAKLASLKRRT